MNFDIQTPIDALEYYIDGLVSSMDCLQQIIEEGGSTPELVRYYDHMAGLYCTSQKMLASVKTVTDDSFGGLTDEELEMLLEIPPESSYTPRTATLAGHLISKWAHNKKSLYWPNHAKGERLLQAKEQPLDLYELFGGHNFYCNDSALTLGECSRPTSGPRCDYWPIILGPRKLSQNINHRIRYIEWWMEHTE